MQLSKEVLDLTEELKTMPISTVDGIQLPPLERFIQRAQTICDKGNRDTAELSKYNYDVKKLVRIGVLIEALRKYTSVYSDLQFDSPETRKTFLKLKEEAELCRFDTLAGMECAFGDDENLLGKLSKVREGNSIDDLIQDLSDLKVIAENNPALLDEINFDKTTIERLPVISTELSKVYAQATNDRSVSPMSKMDRDKVYVLLRDMLEELNRRAQFVFRHEEAHAAVYSLTIKPRRTKTKTTKQELAEASAI